MCILCVGCPQVFRPRLQAKSPGKSPESPGPKSAFAGMIREASNKELADAPETRAAPIDTKSNVTPKASEAAPKAAAAPKPAEAAPKAAAAPKHAETAPKPDPPLRLQLTHTSSPLDPKT